ncbi:hypothetical protein ABT297_00320 [Dactylosporangium sp. NPDC000555]|uniref:hypothetical protein n=1 Tax=Dactylosporangium sp. NPDC000555 TaxID=3154260 RepID=UPI00331D05C1
MDGAGRRPSWVLAGPRWAGLLIATLRRHRGLAGLLLIGIAARLLLAKAYSPALWFDDYRNYLRESHPLTPGNWHPAGYSAWLRVLMPLGDLWTVTAAQHLLGLTLPVAVYAMLHRRAAPRWLALVAAAPLALDARAIVLEHYLIADSLFAALLVGGLVLLLWRDKPNIWLSLAAGLLLGGATLVRVIGLPLCALAGGYLLVRWVGWRPLLGFATAMLVTLGGYAVWFHSHHDEYGLTGWSGRFLYGRTAGISDCDRLKLTEQERRLCPVQPLGQRPERPDWFVWSPDSPAQRYPDEPLLKSFAVKVITQQPGDYAFTVTRDVVRYFFYPDRRLGPNTQCLDAYWDLGKVVKGVDCFPHVAADGSTEPASLQRPSSTKSRTAFRWYAAVFTLPFPVQFLLVVGIAVALAWRPRRPGWSYGSGALLLVGCGLAIITISFATSMFERRYGHSASPLLVMAGAFAWLRVRAATRPAPDEPVLPERNLDADTTT